MANDEGELYHTTLDEQIQLRRVFKELVYDVPRNIIENKMKVVYATTRHNYITSTIVETPSSCCHSGWVVERTLRIGEKMQWLCQSPFENVQQND